MNAYKKPLPTPTPWSRPFWEGCKRQELLIQECEDCGEKVFYPKQFCSSCLSSDLQWIKASGKGKVYTFTVIHSYQPTEFSDDVPYVVAVVRLDEGVQLMSNLIDCKLEDIKCDMDIEVVFDDVTEEVSLPKFRPVRGGIRDE